MAGGSVNNWKDVLIEDLKKVEDRRTTVNF